MVVLVKKAIFVEVNKLDYGTVFAYRTVKWH